MEGNNNVNILYKTDLKIEIQNTKKKGEEIVHGLY